MATDVSSSSPSRASLSQVFSKARRNRDKKKGDTASITAISDDSGTLGSVDSSIDRLKLPNESSSNLGESNGIGKLLNKVPSKRRRRQRVKEAEERASEEAARGRDVANRGTLEDLPADEDDDNDDDDTRGAVDGSSLITYESEDELSSSYPPPLESHPSHIGYLTTSSPLVKATTLSENSQLDAHSDLTPRASTFLVESLNTNTATSGQPESTTIISGDRLQTGPFAGRIKAAGTNSSIEGASSSGVLTPAKPDKRRNSVASRLISIFPEKQNTEQRSTSPETPRITRKVSIPTTPPNEQVAPLIVNTPPTPTDTKSPRFGSPQSELQPVGNPNIVTSPSGNMISRRRVKSGSSSNLQSSRLSNITNAPLTPTIESPAVTPYSTQQSGFFSSVLSAAQNAATTLSSITNTTAVPAQSNTKSNTQDPEPEEEEAQVEAVSEKADINQITEDKELAIKTLGMGDLNLSHLGISDGQGGPAASVPTKMDDSQESRGRAESTATNDYLPHNSSTLALSTTEEPTETKTGTHIEDTPPSYQPRPLYDSPIGDEPINANEGNIFDGKPGINRSGSIRSAIAKPRRKRGSSAATGPTTAIGAAIAAANASVAHPAAQGSAPKLTGFAVASKKRNRDFHQLFRSVPDDDYLIEDYSCALQREILAQGRLYVSEGHLCFSSNIFGWVTTLVMSFDEIVSVEKRSTALIFKNGLVISTLHAKNIFASFTSRDSTYDLIVGIWKLGHPSLRSSLNGVALDETGGGDKTEKYDAPESGSGSGSEDDSEDGDEIYDEDEDEEDGDSYSHMGEGSVAGSEIGEKIISRKPSAAVVGTAANSADRSKDGPSPSASGDFPGPSTHAPTECSDGDTHYEVILYDDVIPAPLGKVYNLIFGPLSVTWLTKWISGEQKCLEMQMDDKKGLTNENKTRSYSYIKPLYASLGPKQTKCLITETLDSIDLEKAVSVTSVTQTPDVPSGNVFSVKTRYCLSWGEGNGTRVQVNCTIEWTGKSWLKAPIEKGAKDGQIQYAKDLSAALRSAISSRSRAGTAVAPGKKGKRGTRKNKASSAEPGKVDNTANAKRVAKKDWGMFEPFHGPLQPLVDIVQPLMTGNIAYGILVGLLIASWFSFRGAGGSGDRRRHDLGESFVFSTPERIAAYEEIWRREESELWAWLDERVGRKADIFQTTRKDRSWGNTLMGDEDDDTRGIVDKLKGESMGDRELRVAIQVTEDKLRALKEAVERKLAPGAGLVREGEEEKQKPHVDDEETID